MRFSANHGRRVGGRSTTQLDEALGHGGEGGWSRDATEEVGSGTVSTRGPPRVRGRTEAWWEEGAGKAKSAASRNFLLKNNIT